MYTTGSSKQVCLYRVSDKSDNSTSCTTNQTQATWTQLFSAMRYFGIMHVVTRGATEKSVYGETWSRWVVLCMFVYRLRFYLHYHQTWIFSQKRSAQWDVIAWKLIARCNVYVYARNNDVMRISVGGGMLKSKQLIVHVLYYFEESRCKVFTKNHKFLN